ncbi:MAG: GNAT family N-acetyltransferase [Microcoleaceae cyanobacterium]
MIDDIKLTPGYKLRKGSGIDRALLLKFMHRTYKELYPDQDFSHLTQTVQQYFSAATPLWWVEETAKVQPTQHEGLPHLSHLTPVAGLWLGNAVDQIGGDRMTHIFLLYVMPQHRRLGIASALVRQAENWTKQRGDRKISLQVFVQNQPALDLYKKLGYQPQSISMIKTLGSGE